MDRGEMNIRRGSNPNRGGPLSSSSDLGEGQGAAMTFHDLFHMAGLTSEFGLELICKQLLVKNIWKEVLVYGSFPS